jgi:hypothetical protein
MSFFFLLRLKFCLVKDQIQVIRIYYKNWRFAVVDMSLGLLYLFSNPYRMCRKFLQKKKVANIHAYGETPLATLEKMAKAFAIQPSDRWLELGSGRGRGCFWMSQFWGCEVRGVDFVPTFISRASWLSKTFSLRSVDFQQKEMMETDFSWPTVVFLYSTCMSDEEINALLVPMRSLPMGARVITISEPISHPNYILTNSLPVSFPWGKTTAYLHTYYS